MNESPLAQTSRSAATGLRFMLCATVVVLLSAAALTVAVDPYGYFGTTWLRTLNERKPAALQHDRLFKAGLARRHQADCLLAGSSRVGEGIDPDDHQFARCSAVVDLSLAGPNVEEIARIVTLGQARGGGKFVIVSLDFFAFNATRGATRGGQVLLAESTLDQWRASVQAVWNLDAVGDSLLTLWHQDGQPLEGRTGSMNQAYLAAAEQSRSTRATFARALRGYIGHNLPAPLHGFEEWNSARNPVVQLRAFLFDQYRLGNRVVLFFAPVHAWHLELLDALGLWPSWERWRESVADAAQSAARDAGQPGFELWDFAGYSGPSTEPLPADGAALEPLPSFWDSSHFRRSLGSRLLRRMLAPDSGDPYGYRVDSASMSARHALIAREREAWRSRYPQDHLDVRTVVTCFAPKRVRVRLGLVDAESATCRQLTQLTR